MTRDEVQAAMKASPTRFRRNEFALEEDSFESLGVTVEYDEHEKCNAVSYASGFGTILEYDGYRLFEHSAVDVRTWALTRDPYLQPNEGFTSKALGIGMWADWLDGDEVESERRDEVGAAFIIFRPGYYEEEHARMVRQGLLPG